MVGKCANPVCDTQFRFLRDGKLFHVESNGQDTENLPRVQHFWLCESCSREFTVVAAAQGVPVIAAIAKAGA